MEVKNSRGNQVQPQFVVPSDDGVAGVVAAVVTRHHVNARPDVIYHPSFSFIAPLGTHNDDRRHIVPPHLLARKTGGPGNAGTAFPFYHITKGNNRQASFFAGVHLLLGQRQKPAAN
jgi:hypothetical protein